MNDDDLVNEGGSQRMAGQGRCEHEEKSACDGNEEE